MLSPKTLNIVILSITFEALAILAVILRIYCRLLTKKPLKVNDYAIIAALVCSPPALLQNYEILMLISLGFYYRPDHNRVSMYFPVDSERLEQ